MDVALLARDLVAFLAPFLPYLITATEKAVEEAGERIGGDAFNKAKSVWAKLRAKVEAKPAALEAARDVAQTPRDQEAQDNLRYQLKKVLSEDEDLADSIASLLEIDASRERSVEVGGDVRDSIIITGNQNLVQSNTPNKRDET